MNAEQYEKIKQFLMLPEHNEILCEYEFMKFQELYDSVYEPCMEAFPELEHLVSAYSSVPTTLEDMYELYDAKEYYPPEIHEGFRIANEQGVHMLMHHSRILRASQYIGSHLGFHPADLFEESQLGDLVYRLAYPSKKQAQNAEYNWIDNECLLVEIVRAIHPIESFAVGLDARVYSSKSLPSPQAHLYLYSHMKQYMNTKLDSVYDPSIKDF